MNYSDYNHKHLEIKKETQFAYTSMVDKLFNKVFTAMDHSQAVQQVTTILGLPVEQNPQGLLQNKGKQDKTSCNIHRQRITFFCEQCCL